MEKIKMPLSLSAINKLSRVHNTIHKQYQKGHCPICYGKDLDTPDYEGQKSFKIIGDQK